MSQGMCLRKHRDRNASGNPSAPEYLGLELRARLRSAFSLFFQVSVVRRFPRLFHSTVLRYVHFA
jgi:hypothetical protein